MKLSRFRTGSGAFVLQSEELDRGFERFLQRELFA